MRSRQLLTIGLLVTVSAAAFESLAVATIMPATVAEIGGLAYYGWTFSGFTLAQIVGICIAGRLADTSGLVAPFAAGGIAFSLGLLGAGLTPSMPALIAARVLQGCGAGAISALAYAAVGRGYPDAAKPRMLALLSTAWVAPGLIGPALAGAVAQHVGWRWVFLALAPLMLAAAAVVLPGLRRLPAPAARNASSHHVVAAVGLALAGALALEALRWTSPAAALLGLAVAAGAALPSLRHLLPPGTLAARAGQPAAVATAALLAAAFFGAEIFVPLALTELRHQSTTAAGLVLSAATIAWTIGAWFQERFAQRSSRRLLAASGLCAMTAGIAATGLLLSDDVPPAAAMLSWGLAGLGIGVAYSTVALVVLETAPRDEEGTAAAALQLAFVVGTAMGTAATGAIVARWEEDGRALAVAITLVFAVACALAILAFAIGLRLPGAPGTSQR